MACRHRVGLIVIAALAIAVAMTSPAALAQGVTPAPMPKPVASSGAQPSAPLQPADQARSFGLFGEWARYCTRAAGPDNGYTTYAARADGRIDYAATRGKKVVKAVIDAVQMLEGGLLELTFTDPFTKLVRRRALMLQNGELKTMWSFEQGQPAASIANGIVVKTNKPSASLSRCKAGVT
jgi:hypothetical protein